MTAVPTIYTPLVRPPGASVMARLGCGLTALGCLALLVIAARLAPNPAGLGTHTEMGLHDCGFLQSTGIPCPSCGMTTSFSWFVRGNLAASFYIQPMGMAIAIACSVWIWMGFYIAATGRPVYRLLGYIPGKYYGLPVVLLALAAWGWKIFIHVNHMDGWG